MRVFLIFMLLLFPLLIEAQDQITKRDGEQIDCIITKVDNEVIYFDFHDGERRLSSFIPLTEVRSYQKEGNNIPDSLTTSVIVVPNEEIVVDTSKYLKEVDEWVNLASYSQRLGVNATGWSVDYYGYNLRSNSKWIIPLVVGIEGFEIRPDYFNKTDYYRVEMNYLTFGISPFYRLGDRFFLNLGVRLVYGEEKLMGFSTDMVSRTFFGLNPSQGIFFIPESRVGIMLGIGVYEKVLSSKVYKSDAGIKFQIGIKF